MSGMFNIELSCVQSSAIKTQFWVASHQLSNAAVDDVEFVIYMSGFEWQMAKTEDNLQVKCD